MEMEGHRIQVCEICLPDVWLWNTGKIIGKKQELDVLVLGALHNYIPRKTFHRSGITHHY